MTYSGYGVRNNQYAIWNVNVNLPMAGTIVTRVEKEVDNPPQQEIAKEDNPVW